VLWDLLPESAFPGNRIYVAVEDVVLATTFEKFLAKCCGLNFFQMTREDQKVYTIIHETPLEEIPQLINDPGWGVYARWRLKMGR
jgi:hypothetical protein